MKKDVYPADWDTKHRPYVLRRDKYRCVVCGASRGQLQISFRTGRTYKVFLVVTHLDHDAENHKVRLSRLATMCQSCHITYDNVTDPERREKWNKGCLQNKGKGKKSKGIRARIREIKAMESKYYYFGECKSDPRHSKA